MTATPPPDDAVRATAADPSFDPRPIRIFDTTLRDGEQSPGASLTSDEKLVLAHELARLGVDVIEAGFPAASADESTAVSRIAREVGRADGPIVCGLARTHRGDIETAFEAVRHAMRPRIHTFIATSDLHLEHKLRMTRDEVLDRIGQMVSYARSLCEDVEFSTEDAGRSDRQFLARAVTVAIEAGATTLNIPDTVGYLVPEEVGDLFRFLRRTVPAADTVTWSAHCHDDLGLATANSLAALDAGARQVEVTINGIGERAGNASLEEVVMAIRTRARRTGLRTAIDSRQLTRVSAMVSHHTGMVVPPNKAIVGRNAFAHEAGIHQHGMLEHPGTYEIMTPESVGRSQSRLVLGKHSGRRAFRARLEELGFRLDEQAMGAAFARFAELADRKKVVRDADLRALVDETAEPPAGGYEMVDMQVQCSRPGSPTATVRLRTPAGEEKVAAAVGNGSVDAIFEAIQTVVDVPNVLVDFSIHNVDEGIDALGAVSVRLASHRGARRSYGGYGTDTDVLVASAEAYLSAINRLVAGRRPDRQRPAATPADLAAMRSIPPETVHGFLDEADEPFDPAYTFGIP